MAEVEKEAKDLVGPVSEHEVEKGIELRRGKVSLNCVLSQMGLVYEEHKVHLKRRISKMLIGFLPSLRCRRILRQSAREVDAGFASALFTIELAEASDLHTGSMSDVESRAMADYAKNITKGKLGKEMFLMNVGSGSAKR